MANNNDIKKQLESTYGEISTIIKKFNNDIESINNSTKDKNHNITSDLNNIFNLQNLILNASKENVKLNDIILEGFEHQKKVIQDIETLEKKITDIRQKALQEKSKYSNIPNDEHKTESYNYTTKIINEIDKVSKQKIKNLNRDKKLKQEEIIVNNDIITGIVDKYLKTNYNISYDDFKSKYGNSKMNTKKKSNIYDNIISKNNGNTIYGVSSDGKINIFDNAIQKKSNSKQNKQVNKSKLINYNDLPEDLQLIVNSYNKSLSNINKLNSHINTTNDSESANLKEILSLESLRNMAKEKNIKINLLTFDGLRHQKKAMEDIEAIETRILNIREASAQQKEKYVKTILKSNNNQEIEKAKEAISVIDSISKKEIRSLDKNKERKKEEIRINKEIVKQAIDNYLQTQHKISYDDFKTHYLKGMNKHQSEINMSKNINSIPMANNTIITSDGKIAYGINGNNKGNSLQNIVQDVGKTNVLFNLVSNIQSHINDLSQVEEKIFDLGVVGQRSLTQIKELRSRMFSMASESRYTASELAEAASEVVRTGRSFEESMEIMKVGSRLATASFDDVKDATNTLVKAMTAFELNASYAAHAANSFHNIVNATPLSLKTFDDSLRQTSAAFGAIVSFSSKSGQELEEYKVKVLDTTAVLTGLQSMLGRTGSQSGTTLKQFATKLIAPQPEAAAKINQELRQKGVNYSAAQLSRDVKEDLDKGLNKLAQLYENGVISYDTLSKFVGTRHVSQIASMLERINKMGGLENAKNVLLNTTSLVDDASKAQASWTNEWKKLGNSIDSTKGIMMSFLDGPGVLFIKTINQILSGLQKLQNTLGDEFTSALLGATGIYAGGKVIKSYRDTAQTVSDIAGLFKNASKSDRMAIEMISQWSTMLETGGINNKKIIEDILNQLSTYSEEIEHGTEATYGFKSAFKALKGGEGISGATKALGKANLIILGLTAAMFAGLLAWKKYEKVSIDFQEAMKDTNNVLSDYRNNMMESTKSSKFNNAILSEIQAFDNLRSSIDNAKYALNDILDKMGEIKPIKIELSDKQDQFGVSELNRQAMLRAFGAKEEVRTSFASFFKDEIKAWRENSDNIERIRHKFFKELNKNTEYTITQASAEDYIKYGNVNFNKLQAKSEDYEYIKLLSLLQQKNNLFPKLHNSWKYDRIAKDTYEDNYKEILSSILQKLNLTKEEYNERISTGNTKMMYEGREINLDWGKIELTKKAKEFGVNLDLLNELEKSRISIINEQINSIKDANSVLKTFSEFYRNKISEDIERRIGNYGKSSLNNLSSSDTQYGKFVNQYIQSNADSVKRLGINLDIIPIGNAEINKRIGESLAVQDKLSDIKNQQGGYFKHMFETDKELSDLKTSLENIGKWNITNQEFYEYISDMINVDNSSMKSMNKEISKNKDKMQKKLYKNMKNFEGMVSNINDPLSLFLTTEEQLLINQEDSTNILKEYREKIDKKELKNITQKLVKNAEKYQLTETDIYNYSIGAIDNFTEEQRKHLQNVFETYDPNNIVKNALSTLDNLIITVLLKTIPQLSDTIISNFTDSVNNFDDNAKKILANKIISTGLLGSINQTKETENYQKANNAIIEYESNKDIIKNNLEQIDINKKYSLLKNNVNTYLKKLDIMSNSDIFAKEKIDLIEHKKILQDSYTQINYNQQKIAELENLRSDKIGDEKETQLRIYELEMENVNLYMKMAEDLTLRKEKIIKNLNKYYEFKDFNFDVYQKIDELIIDRNKKIYEQASTYYDIQGNVIKQSRLEEKQKDIIDKYTKQLPLVNGEDYQNLYKEFATEYNRNVQELFSLQTELISSQKNILEKSIKSSLDNMSRMAKGESLKIDVESAKDQFAKALSSLVYGETKSPEMMTLEFTEDQLKVQQQMLSELSSINSQLNIFTNILKKFNVSIPDITTPTLKNYSQYESNKLKTDDEISKYIKKQSDIYDSTDKRYEINQKAIYDIYSNTVKNIEGKYYKEKYITTDKNIVVPKTDRIAEKLYIDIFEKVYNSKNKQDDNYIIKNFDNNKYALLNKNNKEMVALATKNDNNKFLFSEYTRSETKEEMIDHIISTTKKAIKHEIKDININKSPYVNTNTNEYKIEFPKNFLQKDNNVEPHNKINNVATTADNSAFMGKLVSTMNALSSLGVILQDFRNSEFEKKLNDIKKSFDDQKDELKKQIDISTNNSDKFAKEVEMWNLEATQNAQLENMQIDNTMENNLVAINKTLSDNAVEIIQQLTAINKSINGNSFDIFGTNVQSDGLKSVFDKFGNISIIDNNGSKSSLKDILSKPSHNTINKDITNNFDEEIYNSAINKLNNGTPLTSSELAQISLHESDNSLIQVEQGNISDYYTSIISMLSGLQGDEGFSILSNGISKFGRSLSGNNTNKFINNVLNRKYKDLNKLFDTKYGEKIFSNLSKNQTVISNGLKLTGGTLSSLGGGFQLGQMLGTGKFDLAGIGSTGLSLYGGASALSGTALGSYMAGTSLGTALGGSAAVGGALAAGAIALPAAVFGAYASKQVARRKKAQAQLKINDELRKREEQQREDMIKSLMMQGNNMSNTAVGQNTSVGYDEAMRRALMTTPLSASSSELFKDYTVSYRGGKFGTGHKRRKWVYSAADATVGISDFGYNSISSIDDTYGLLNAITNKINDIKKELSLTDRDSGSRENREAWAKKYASMEASELLYNQIKDLQNAMIKSMTTLTQTFFGFETIALNEKGSIAQEGEKISKYDIGSWNERANLLNTFVNDFIKAGNTVGETISTIFINGANNAFIKNNTELNKLLTDLENNFKNIASTFVNPNDLLKSAEYELSSGKNTDEVYKSILNQLKNAGYGDDTKFIQAEEFLKDKNYEKLVEVIKDISLSSNKSDEYINNLIKSIQDLEKIQSNLETSMRDFVGDWIENGGNLSDIISTMDNFLSRSADLLTSVLIDKDSSAGLENFKSIINDKILPSIKKSLIDSMSDTIFSIENMLKDYKESLLNGNLSFNIQGTSNIKDYISNLGNTLDMLANPTENFDKLINLMGEDSFKKLLSYKNTIEEINNALYDRMTIDEKISYNQDKLNEQISKYKTQIINQGKVENIGNILGQIPFSKLEQELQNLLSIPVEERNSKWKESYEQLSQAIEKAKGQYGSLNNTITELESVMSDSTKSTQEFTKGWFDGIINGKYETIKDQLSFETQDLIDSVFNSLSSQSWEDGATSVGKSIAGNIIDSYKNELINSGKLKSVIGLVNEMMFDNLNFIENNGILNFDMLYQLSQQTQKMAVENETNRQRLEAVNSMFDYNKEIRYSSLEKEIDYKTSSTKESIYNINNYNNFNVSGLISSTGDMTIMANALAPYIIEAMRNYGY